jgi:hypothetical protein
MLHYGTIECTLDFVELLRTSSNFVELRRTSSNFVELRIIQLPPLPPIPHPTHPNPTWWGEGGERGGGGKSYLATRPKILRKTIGKTKEMYSWGRFESEVGQIQENHLYPGPSQSRGGKSPLPRPMEVRVEVENHPYPGPSQSRGGKSSLPRSMEVRVEVENHLYREIVFGGQAQACKQHLLLWSLLISLLLLWSTCRPRLSSRKINTTFPVCLFLFKQPVLGFLIIHSGLPAVCVGCLFTIHFPPFWAQ